MKKVNPKQIKYILLSRCDKLGDLILTLPVIDYLLQINPDFEIDMLVNPQFALIAKLHPKVHKVFIEKGEGEADLPSDHYDLAINFWESPARSRYIQDLKIPIRVGHKHNQFLTHALPWVQRRIALRPQIWQNLDLIKMLGPEWDMPYQPELKITEPRLDIAEIQTKYNLPLNFWSGDNVPGKECFAFTIGTSGCDRPWSSKRYAELAKILIDENAGRTIIILGVNSDKSLSQQLVNQLDPRTASRVVNLVGQTDLRELIWILNRVYLQVVGNTGPAHLAAALGSRQVVIYPAKAPAVTRWGSWSTRSLTVRQFPPCEIICATSSCSDPVCESGITAELVKTQIDRFTRNPALMQSVEVSLNVWEKETLIFAFFSRNNSAQNVLESAGWKIAQIYPKGIRTSARELIKSNAVVYLAKNWWEYLILNIYAVYVSNFIPLRPLVIGMPRSIDAVIPRVRRKMFLTRIKM